MVYFKTTYLGCSTSNILLQRLWRALCYRRIYKKDSRSCKNRRNKRMVGKRSKRFSTRRCKMSKVWMHRIQERNRYNGCLVWFRFYTSKRSSWKRIRLPSRLISRRKWPIQRLVPIFIINISCSKWNSPIQRSSMLWIRCRWSRKKNV